MTRIRDFSNLQVTAIGEVLWDLVAEERHLGGAPFNFTYHTSCLGAKSSIITRVGADDLGSEIRQRAEVLGMDTSFIQRDHTRATGTARATLTDGSASYEFPEDAAWDHLELTDNIRELLDRSDVIYFGTLAQRSPGNALFLQTVAAAASPRALLVADLNLRAPSYTAQIVRNSLDYAKLLKINDEELVVLRQMFGLPDDDDKAVRTLMDTHQIDTVAVTRGAAGAEAYRYQERSVVAGMPVTVADTIGAGDAFTAAFSLMIASGTSLDEALQLATLAGAYVATQRGATPELTCEGLLTFRLENLPGPTL